MTPTRRLQGERLQEAIDELRKPGVAIGIRIPDLDPKLLVQARVLVVRPDALVVEHPGAEGRYLPIQAGTTLILCWSFRNGTVEAEVKAKPNGEESLRPGELILEAPSQVQALQRRGAPRIPPPTSMVATVFTSGSAVQGISARISDVSYSGCSLLVEGPDGGMLRSGADITIRLEMPDISVTAIDLRARIIRIVMDPKQGTHAGIEFLFDPVATSSLRDCLSRYIAYEEKLRRAP